MQEEDIPIGKNTALIKNSTASKKTIIEWQLRYLSQKASELKANDLDWTIKMETSYKNKGYLSPREQEILAEIYARY